MDAGAVELRTVQESDPEFARWRRASVEVKDAVFVVEMKHVTTTDTNHQYHAMACESPPTVLAGFFLLELCAMAQRAREMGCCHGNHGSGGKQGCRVHSLDQGPVMRIWNE